MEVVKPPIAMATLEAVNKVLRETLACETERDVARVCLRVAEDLTESKFGFIGEANGGGLFDTIALSDPGWKDCRLPKSKATRLIRGMKLRGYWGKALLDNATQIVNEPATHPERIGVPEGHPPITSFLGVPLRRGGRPFGIIALANKSGGYNDADREAIEALSEVFSECLYRKRIEQGHEARKLEGLVQERTADIQTQLDQVFAMLDSLSEIIYVSDPNTYEVLFANKVLCGELGRNPAGGKCYEELQGRDSPCEFCNNEQLLQTGGGLPLGVLQSLAESSLPYGRPADSLA